MGVTIVKAVSSEDLQDVRCLLEEYECSLGLDLRSQGFAEEMASLPGRYAAPTGSLLLARVDGLPAGCVALRSLDDSICEMKRLFVRPEHRGAGLGRLLAQRILLDAGSLSYQCMRLDTLPALMPRAAAMYQALGFRVIPPYGEHPLPDAVFMELLW